VLAAINLNDQISLTTEKITYERADRHLTREFETFELPAAEMAPKDALGLRGVVS
jgi:hypothetical protein